MTEEKQTSEVSAAPPSPILRDKRTPPEGVVPKQAQGYVIAGLTVLILMAVMFSKNHAKSPAKDTTPVAGAISSDINQRKIQELEQDLSADQRRTQQQRQERNSTAAGLAGIAATNASASSASGVASPAPQLPPPSEPERDRVADAEKALAFKARFASNLVTGRDAHPSPPDSADAMGHSEASNSLRARSSSLPQAPDASAAKRAPEVSVNAAQGQPFVVFEGTTIDTVLVNRLDGEFSGPVKVMVTNPVYSEDRQHLLVPEGTFVLGNVQKVAGLGQKRLAITFHRLLMPDGYSVDLDQFRGLDQAGETGLKDKVDNHYAEIFGVSIALGLIAGAAETTNQNQGYNQSGSEAYKSGIASSLSQSGANVLDRFINIPPTLTIREGHRIKVYITQDMLLPAYDSHTVPGDI